MIDKPLVYSLLLFSLITLSIQPAIASDLPNTRILGAEYLFNRAQDLYSKGDFGKARLLYHKAMDRGGNPATISFQIGNTWFRENNFARAAAAYRRASRYESKWQAPALFNYGTSLFRLKQFGPAIAAYERSLRLNPDNPDAWVLLAEIHLKAKNPVGAQRALEKVLKLNQGDISSLYQLAELHMQMGESHRSLDIIRKAHIANPQENDFLFYLGDLHRSLGQMNEAKKAYQQGLIANPEQVEVLYKLADVFTELGNSFQAMETLRKIQRIDPKFTDAAVFLGNLSFDAGWLDRAKEAYLSAAKAGNKEGMLGLRNIAFELLSQGRKEEAIQILQEALKIQPNDRDIKLELESIQTNEEAGV